MPIHGTLIHARTGAHIYVFCSQYTDGLGLGVHCIKKRLTFVRPMHQVRPSLPFSHTHSAQSITNLDTARDHLTHTREPDIGWRRRAAPSDACLPAGSSLDVIGDRGSLVNDNDPLINSWGLCLIVIGYGIQGSLAIKKNINSFTPTWAESSENQQILARITETKPSMCKRGNGILGLQDCNLGLQDESYIHIYLSRTKA